MKEELVHKITTLHEALSELHEAWRELDWSVVPEVVQEQYPFKQDLLEMEQGTLRWLDTIKKT